MCPSLTTAPKRSSRKILLLAFLRGLLEDSSNSHLIVWTDKSRQEFKMVNHKKVAELWGATKPGRRAEVMSYDNMCKSLRIFCSKDKTLEKVEGRKFTWRFLEPLSPCSSGISPNPAPFNIENILGTDKCPSTLHEILKLALSPPVSLLTPPPTPTLVSSPVSTPPPIVPFNFFMNTFLMMQLLTPPAPGQEGK